MRQNRIFSPTPIVSGTEVELSNTAAQHVARVLRLRAGDSIMLFDGSGGEHAASLTLVDKRSVRAIVGDASFPAAESALDVTIWHGLCRGTRMDYVMQKSTELGATRIQPMLTSRCVVKLDEQRTAKRLEHWQSIAISAAEQSGRCVIPQIDKPASIESLMRDAEAADLRIIFDTEGDLAISELPTDAQSIVVCCGPEGGFSPDELRLAESAEFLRICLGPRVLRTETAPVVALSLLQYLMGDLDVAKTRL
jgi:16S rRNA (uracil1498-N3)-methyltransferase